MLVGPGTLTADELAAGTKGFWKEFDDYVDWDAPISITLADYAKLVAWCEPYMARRCEVQGAVACRFEPEAGAFRAVTIERVYVMAGNSESFRTTCKLDSEEMLKQMQADYPGRTAFRSDEVGVWHLHPGYYASLSVGDVEECRHMLRASGAPDTKVLQLLMYGDGRGYQLSGYLVGLEEVNRLPVRIREPETGGE